MRFLKVAVTFAIGFALAWIMVLTFSQTEFRQAVPLNLLFHKTHAIAIYVYLGATFSLGLIIGLIAALVNHLSLTRKIRGIKKQLRQREETIVTLETRLRECSAAASTTVVAEGVKYQPKPDTPSGL